MEKSRDYSPTSSIPMLEQKYNSPVNHDEGSRKSSRSNSSDPSPLQASELAMSEESMITQVISMENALHTGNESLQNGYNGDTEMTHVQTPYSVSSMTMIMTTLIIS